MPSSLVSVVVPTYNRAYCLGAAIDSALAQSCVRAVGGPSANGADDDLRCEIEVIVIDDGSTDETPALMQARYAQDPRVRYLRKPNGGVSAARNAGLAIARGDYIALLDSDDTWRPFKLAAELACLRRFPEAGMVWTNMDAVDDDGKLVSRRYLATMYDAWRWFPHTELFPTRVPFAEFSPALAVEIGSPTVYVGDIYSEMILGNLVHTSTVLLRRERFLEVRAFDETLRHSGEDYDFHLRTCRAGPVAFLDVASIDYREGGSDQLTYAPRYGVDVARNFLRTVSGAIDRDRARIHLPPGRIEGVLAEAHAWLADCLFDRGQHAEARLHFQKSLALDPRQPRLYAQLLLSFASPGVADRTRRLYRRARALLRR